MHWFDASITHDNRFQDDLAQEGREVRYLRQTHQLAEGPARERPRDIKPADGQAVATDRACLTVACEPKANTIETQKTGFAEVCQSRLVPQDIGVAGTRRDDDPIDRFCVDRQMFGRTH